MILTAQGQAWCPRVSQTPVGPWLVGILTALLALSGCATIPSVDLTTLLQPDPRLPRKEHIEAIGTLAIQKVVALAPQAAQTLAAYDLNTVTASVVTIMFRSPPDQLVANSDIFEIATYALAHQWGLTQITLDYVVRYDRLITARYEDLKRQKASKAWSNFFFALSSMGYALSNTSAPPSLALSNQLGISHNQQAMQLNTLMADAYQQRMETVEELKLQIGRLKQELVSYSNLLEIYRGWLLKAQQDQKRDMIPDAKRILEAKATF